MTHFRNLFLFIGLLGASSASAQNFGMTGVSHVHFSQVYKDALNVRDVKCGFISSDLFRCQIPLVLPNSPEFGEPSSQNVNLMRLSQGDDGNEIFPGLYQLDMKLSGNILAIDFERDEARRLVYRAYKGILQNGDDYRVKAQEIDEIKISENDLLQATDTFRLRLQKTSFTPVFAEIESLLQKLVDRKKINITRSWSFSFDGVATKEMVLSYCGSEKGKSNKECQSIQSFTRP